MPTFEEGFATAESAADSVLKALNEAAGIARQLRKASQDGNIAAVRRQSERLDGAVNLIRQEVVNASTAWPFTAEDERRYLEEGYGRELQAEAEKRGLQVFERDGRLIAHPSMVRVLPGERAVRIDRRQSSAVRPSRVVGDLAKLQNNPSRFRPQPFLEALYEAYLALAQSDTADRLKLGQVGQVIRLESIYKLFTGLPGSSRDYSQLDFARDLYALQESGAREVRSGARVSLPASTGTRSARGDDFVHRTQRRDRAFLRDSVYGRRPLTNILPLQEWLNVIKEEYLDGFVSDGGSSLKFAVPTRQDLSPLLKARFAVDAGDLGYLVVAVDAGETRVHMLQDIFFRIAEQIDWRHLARRVVLRLAGEAGYRTETADLEADTPILEAISEASAVENKAVDESLIRMELRNPLFQSVTRNGSMSRDFRVAMTQLCLTEMGGVGQNQEAVPLIEWLTGVNRRVSSVRRYEIYNSIVRTNARHFFESLLFWVRFVGYSGTCVILDDSRVTLRRNPRDGLRFYSRSAVMDHYELLRELIDGTDRLEGLLMAVLADEEFLDEDTRGKGFFIYQALRNRIADEVRSRTQANPMATLVRLSDGPIVE